MKYLVWPSIIHSKLLLDNETFSSYLMLVDVLTWCPNFFLLPNSHLESLLPHKVSHFRFLQIHNFFNVNKE